MKSENIIENLKNEGFTVDYGKWEYWENIPYVEHKDGNRTYIADTFTKLGSMGVNMDYEYDDVKKAVAMKVKNMEEYYDLKSEQEAEEELKMLGF